MIQNPYTIELADVANELGANVKITFHTATFTFTAEQLRAIKEKQQPTNLIACVIIGLYRQGMSQEQVEEFLQEADNARSTVGLAFEAPDDQPLEIQPPAHNPALKSMIASCGQLLQSEETDEGPD